MYRIGGDRRMRSSKVTFKSQYMSWKNTRETHTTVCIDNDPQYGYLGGACVYHSSLTRVPFVTHMAFLFQNAKPTKYHL